MEKTLAWIVTFEDTPVCVYVTKRDAYMGLEKLKKEAIKIHECDDDICKRRIERGYEIIFTPLISDSTKDSTASQNEIL